VESIQRALEEAELMADCKIRNVYAGIAGSHIRSFNSSGMVAIKDKEVTATDVARVIETAKAVNIPTDQQCCTRCRRSSSSTARKMCASLSA
jgi:cell division protein FtsA